VIRSPKIVSEYSAQRRSHPPNAALKKALRVVVDLTGSKNLGTVADVGCGKLRHYKILSRAAGVLWLVDSKRQMAAMHRDGNVYYTISSAAESAQKHGREVYALDVERFGLRRDLIDVAICVAVFDVVTREHRRQITKCVAERLRRGGYFVVIIPRNDSTITRRFTKENKYRDGHVFTHHGIQTFFSNFDRYESVIRDCKKEKLELVRDISTYRQVCILFRKR
jgi:SAM-dependent methyltransferase